MHDGPARNGTDRAARRRLPAIERRRQIAFRLAVAAFIWSVGLLIAALAVPAYTGHTESGPSGLTISTVTVVKENGAWILLPLALPAAISAFVWLALRRRWFGGSQSGERLAWIGVALLTAFALFSIASVGIFILPAAVLLAFSVALTRVRLA